MNKKRIKVLADFFYSSNSVLEVPIRLSATCGSYSGFDLSERAFMELMYILSNSKELKKDLENFRKDYE